MSDTERYISKAVYREDNLYYDFGYRFSTGSDKKTKKAFNKDYTLVLLGLSFFIQIFLSISQIFTILTLLILFLSRYIFSEKSKSPVFMLVIIASHVYDYYLGKVIALPGKIVQGKLTGLFWLTEMIWVFTLAYQLLIIFQPYTPIIAKGQSVKPDTREAILQYNKMQARLDGSDFALVPLTKLINIDKLQKTLKNSVQLVLVIILISILLDITIWRIIFSLGGGEIIFEQYVITGMSLILFIILISFAHLIAPDNDKNKE